MPRKIGDNKTIHSSRTGVFMIYQLRNEAWKYSAQNYDIYIYILSKEVVSFDTQL